jgi:hypothetical protein
MMAITRLRASSIATPGLTMLEPNTKWRWVEREDLYHFRLSFACNLREVPNDPEGREPLMLERDYDGRRGGHKGVGEVRTQSSG